MIVVKTKMERKKKKKKCIAIYKSMQKLKGTERFPHMSQFISQSVTTTIYFALLLSSSKLICKDKYF